MTCTSTSQPESPRPARSVNALGSLLSADALALPGLTLTVLLAPVWSVVVGLTVVRGRLADGT